MSKRQQRSYNIYMKFLEALCLVTLKHKKLCVILNESNCRSKHVLVDCVVCKLCSHVFLGNHITLDNIITQMSAIRQVGLLILRSDNVNDNEREFIQRVVINKSRTR